MVRSHGDLHFLDAKALSAFSIASFLLKESTKNQAVISIFEDQFPLKFIHKTSKFT